MRSSPALAQLILGAIVHTLSNGIVTGTEDWERVHWPKTTYLSLNKCCCLTSKAPFSRCTWLLKAVGEDTLVGLIYVTLTNYLGPKYNLCVLCPLQCTQNMCSLTSVGPGNKNNLPYLTAPPPTKGQEEPLNLLLSLSCDQVHGSPKKENLAIGISCTKNWLKFNYKNCIYI